MKAEVADEGEALISGRLLADISSSLPAKPVDITADGTRWSWSAAAPGSPSRRSR